jgi:hypothetical protein
MTVITGKVASITVSGGVISGTGKGAMEATVVMGKEHETFLPVGTDVTEVLTGVKTCTGTVRAAWYTGGTTFQALLDGDTAFEVTIQLTGNVSISASGCKIDTLTRRTAPGTDVMTEEIAFTGRDWY